MVPEGWRSLPLGDMLERITNGLVYNPRQTEGVRVTRIETISDARIDVSKVGFAEYSPAMEQYRLQRGDILYSHINSLKHIGKVAFFDSEEVLYHGMNLLLLRANNSVLPKYLYYLLDSSVGQRYAHTYAKRAVNQASINIAELRQFHFKVPPLYEQEHIIEILQTWDTSIAQTQALIAATRERKRGLMQVLLTGKKRFKEFANDPWHEHSLGQLLLEVNERNKAGKHTKVLSVTNTRGFVLPEEVFSKRVASANLSNYKVVRAGQFAYNPSRLNVGSLGLLQGHELGLLSPMYVVFRTKAAVDSHYLYHWFQSDVAKGKILRSAEGSVRESVSFSALSRMSISLPSLQEQHRITSVLSTADAEIENLEKQLEAYKRQKRGLMQQLLTGKKRVEVDDMEAVA